MSGRIAHRPEAAHRQARHRAVPAAEHAEVAVDVAHEGAHVERLPLPRAVRPVGVPAGLGIVPAVGHHDDEGKLGGELFDVGLLRPRPVRVAGAVEEVEDRVPDACRRIARRQQDADGAVGHDEARGHRHGDVEAAWCVADRGRARGGAEDERGDHPHDDVPMRALLHRLAPMPCAVSGSIRRWPVTHSGSETSPIFFAAIPCCRRMVPLSRSRAPSRGRAALPGSRARSSGPCAGGASARGGAAPAPDPRTRT